MPVYVGFKDKGTETAQYYEWYGAYFTPEDWMNDCLRQLRKQAITDQQFFTQQQNLCGKEERELGKFFKEEARHQLRIQRAITLMLPWLGIPDANQEPVRPKFWPIDLAEELDEITRRLDVKRG